MLIYKLQEWLIYTFIFDAAVWHVIKVGDRHL